MKKSLVALVLALFAFSSASVFAQDVPEKCKALKGDDQKKCIEDAKKAMKK